MSRHDDLRDIALAEFAAAGYAATSLQRIADLAGTSKASVLYHYSSKEQLLEAAIGPALDALDGLVATAEDAGFSVENREAFILGFVDFLLAHRQQVHLVINQQATIVDTPAIDRAQALMNRLASFFHSYGASTAEKLRLGVAFGGAAYSLAAAEELGIDEPPVEEIRRALIDVMLELLVPDDHRTPADRTPADRTPDGDRAAAALPAPSADTA